MSGVHAMGSLRDELRDALDAIKHARLNLPDLPVNAREQRLMQALNHAYFRLVSMPEASRVGGVFERLAHWLNRPWVNGQPRWQQVVERWAQGEVTRDGTVWADPGATLQEPAETVKLLDCRLAGVQHDGVAFRLYELEQHRLFVRVQLAHQPQVLGFVLDLAPPAPPAAQQPGNGRQHKGAPGPGQQPQQPAQQ